MQTINKIPVDGSDAYWEQNANYPNNYTLEKTYFEIGKSWINDKSGINVYGWIQQEMYGANEGKFKAGHPTIWDDETGSDAVELGFFDTPELAMQAVLSANHPDYGGIHC